MKVYCKNCKYYFCYEGQEDCCTPQNYRDTYYREADAQVDSPEKINKDNNCKWFEDKNEPDLKRMEKDIRDNKNAITIMYRDLEIIKDKRKRWWRK